MTTAERLEQYYPFDQSVIDTVADFADFQKGFESYKDFFGAVGVPDVQFVSHEGNSGSTVVDLRPVEHDPHEALVLHLPMANPLDANQLFQVATIAGTNPNRRVIAFGNPSGGQYRGQILDRKARAAVTNGNLQPLVEDVARYIDAQGIELTSEAGYSFGALKVAASAVAAEHSVSELVAIEPVTPTRSLLRLGTDFASTNAALKQYTEAPDLPAYRNARDNDMTDFEFFRGLLRPTNLAIARSLAHISFKDVITEVIKAQPFIDCTFVWGSESELASDVELSQMVDELDAAPFKNYQVNGMRLEGQKHALANDVHLHAAIIKQALYDPNSET